MAAPTLQALSESEFQLVGALNFDTVPALVDSLPMPPAEVLTLDFSLVDEADSAAVALMLEWKRQLQRCGKQLQLRELPAHLADLLSLYEVEPLLV